MQTRFTDAQRQDPAIRDSESILRSCVHCGFCTATCPTYLLEGDELDSPRGRIYLIKDMLESGRPATAEVVRHVDRCLSCLGCMTTCPSGVHYQHLVDHARAHIEQTYRRPWHDRVLRSLLVAVMTEPARFRRLLALARWCKPLARFLPGRPGAMLALVPARAAIADALPAAVVPATRPAVGRTSGSADRASVPRVAMLTGCVQSVLGASANAATRRLLERMGLEVVAVDGCCGSLPHHLGRADETRRLAGSFAARFAAAAAGHPLDALVVNASGCGTHLKDLGFVLREDAGLAGSAAAISGLTRDVTELVAERGLPRVVNPGQLRVAYHSACSLQHGQKIEAPPRALLRAAGFTVVEIPEGHVCCGSAGTYNLLQPEFARRLAARKLERIATLDVDVIAAGNLGCMTQLATGTALPIVHTVELLDWATGGPRPAALGLTPASTA